MSKTIELQVEKSRVLIEGLSKNVAELGDKGIRQEELDVMSAELAELAKVNEECDAIREALTAKVKEVNTKLIVVKDKFAEKKKIIKNNYPQEEWARYGVMDKR
jgi:hypothetical protein